MAWGANVMKWPLTIEQSKRHECLDLTGASCGVRVANSLAAETGWGRGAGLCGAGGREGGQAEAACRGRAERRGIAVVAARREVKRRPDKGQEEEGL